MNLFHPMGYSDSQLTFKQRMLRQSWILSCGRIPDQLFHEPHPECKPRVPEAELDLRLNEAGGHEIPHIPDTFIACICSIAVD
jgi:hypothetical protein